MKALLLIALIATVSAGVSADDWLSNYVLSNMNWTVDPCSDFYSFACGTWIANNEIPSDRGQIDRAFTGIDEHNEKVLYSIVQNPSNLKLNSFYNACLNLNAIQTAGLDPIAPFLAAVDDGLDGTIDSVSELIATLHYFGMDVFWNVDIQIDPGNPKTNIITLGQGGLSLPDATLYLDPESDTVRQQYLAHITKMFKLIGSSDAQAAQAAQDVLTLETMIAKVTALPDELTDPFTTYNKVSYTNFKSIIAPGINWDVYFADVGIVNPQALNLDVPHFYGNISVIIQNSQDMWSSYLKWNVVHATASLLTKEIVDEDFAFFSKILRGINQQPSRNRTCVRSTDAYLGELLGVQFAERSFAGDSKKTAQDMIDAIEAAFGSNLKGLNWMDDDTRAKAQLKLSKVYNMIGYPDVPTNYTFPVNPDTFAENVIIARAWKFQRTMATLNMPSDRKKWDMTPATVNAYYDPTRNIMVFPAGIMQTPYFNLTFPLPLRFGGAGMIMGHELSHGFDNQGRDFDGDGLLTDWWAPQTSKNFDDRVQCVIDQYSKFEVLPGLFVNGKLTQGENIADMGGIKMSYNALSAIMGDQLSQPSPIPHLTNAQLYFVGFAQGWCSKATPQQTRVRVKTDPHSPPRFRVTGSLVNFPSFAQAFNCPVGSPMNPTNRCTVW